jgi:hypothetical protein
MAAVPSQLFGYVFDYLKEANLTKTLKSFKDETSTVGLISFLLF